MPVRHWRRTPPSPTERLLFRERSVSQVSCSTLLWVHVRFHLVFRRLGKDESAYSSAPALQLAPVAESKLVASGTQLVADGPLGQAPFFRDRLRCLPLYELGHDFQLGSREPATECGRPVLQQPLYRAVIWYHQASEYLLRHPYLRYRASYLRLNVHAAGVLQRLPMLVLRPSYVMHYSEAHVIGNRTTKPCAQILLTLPRHEYQNQTAMSVTDVSHSCLQS